MCTVRYHFAYDEHDSIIDIDNVSSEYRKEHDFHCISCGALMMARLGNEKAHHFAHKGGESCGSETYLHKLAKLMLKRKFDNSQSFVIEYTLRIKCSRNPLDISSFSGCIPPFIGNDDRHFLTIQTIVQFSKSLLKLL